MGQYFGTSRNGIENKQSGTEGVIVILLQHIVFFVVLISMPM